MLNLTNNLGGIGLNNDILSQKKFNISNKALLSLEIVFFFKFRNWNYLFNGVIFPIFAFLLPLCPTLKSRHIIEHFSSFLIDNKGCFKRFLIFFGIFLPYYRVLFRLFRPIISVIFEHFLPFYIWKKSQNTLIIGQKSRKK